jgi:uncharacterized protein (DUF2249 family)
MNKDTIRKLKDILERAESADPKKLKKEVSEFSVELDLRIMPPFERHTKIFEVWDTLKPGKTMRIINDHDPKPLHYQFEIELPNTYIWNYRKNGPKDWIVDITRK